MDSDLALIRQEYEDDPDAASELISGDVDPFDLFAQWLHEAIAHGVVEPNAMVLSTVDQSGPSSRTVLLKGLDHRGFVFFTNQHSRKGRELAANPACALHFGWYALHRQVRVEGDAEVLDRAEVADYFAQRPRGAQVGAWASAQSEPIAHRADLERNFVETAARFEGQTIEPPPQWGGYLVRPRVFEFWQGRRNRLHDRVRFVRSGQPQNGWQGQRLAP